MLEVKNVPHVANTTSTQQNDVIGCCQAAPLTRKYRFLSHPLQRLQTIFIQSPFRGYKPFSFSPPSEATNHFLSVFLQMLYYKPFSFTHIAFRGGKRFSFTFPSETTNRFLSYYLQKLQTIFFHSPFRGNK